MAERYAELLTGPGVERGLLGPGEVNRVWERHLLNCAAVAPLVPDECRLADLGSGAGLPGLVLALLRPRCSVLLVEPTLRRVHFLRECVTELGLGNVAVVRARAEELRGEVGADVVTARAVAPLRRLAPLAAGLLRPGGTVLAMKGVNAEREVALAAAVFSAIAADEVEVLRVETARAAAIVVRFVIGASRR